MPGYVAADYTHFPEIDTRGDLNPVKCEGFLQMAKLPFEKTLIPGDRSGLLRGISCRVAASLFVPGRNGRAIWIR